MKYFRRVSCVVQALSGLLAIIGWLCSEIEPLSAWLQLPALLIGVAYCLQNGMVLMYVMVMLLERHVKIADAKRLRADIRSQRLRKARS